MEEETKITRELKNSDDVFYKPIEVKPLPPKEIGVDLSNSLLLNMADATDEDKLDISSIESFTRISDSRDKIFTCLDNMYQDSIVSAIVRSYCEDATEPNEKGQIVWAESSDSDTSQYINFLLDSMQIDKNVYSWVECLAKYGDVYIKLFRQSEIDKFRDLFAEEVSDDNTSYLNEDLYIHASAKDDKIVDYVEMEKNPAELFELRKFGKTQGYIKANCATSSQYVSTPLNPEYKYKFKRNDVITYDAKSFVHASLDDLMGRIPEEVDIFITEDKDDEELIDNAYSYSVKRGRSLFYDGYKAWRELMLMQTSMLLNRMTKSSITRIIQVEIGDADGKEAQQLLMNYKQMLEQKSAYNVNSNMQEYTNPSPIENTVYVATHEGKGAITTAQIGGDIDIKGISDVDYYRQRFFGAFAVPAPYFGFMDDNGGFSGGQSLAIVSARYGKSVKHLQACMCQLITDLINVKLQDSGRTKFINTFTIHMKAPVTQEEIDARDNISSQMQIISDIMSNISDIEDIPTRLKVLKSLLANVITNTEVIDILQDYVDELENNSDEEIVQDGTENDNADFGAGGHMPMGKDTGMPEFDFGEPNADSDSNEPIDLGAEENPALNPTEDENALPSGADLGMDLTQ